MKNLNDSVSTLNGVGPKKQEALFDLDIHTIFDLLTYFPFRYEDFVPKEIQEIVDQQTVTLKGEIAAEPTISFYGRRKSRLTVHLLIDHDVIPVTFFNQAWLKKQLQIGHKVLVHGKFNAVSKSMTGIKLMKSNSKNNFSAIYSVNNKITQKTLQQIIQQAFTEYYDVINDFVPKWIIDKFRLESFKKVIHDLHFPKNHDDVKAALRTAKFNEFFLFQMQLQTIKTNHQKNKDARIMADKLTLMPFIEKLPYHLTGAQDCVVNEILADLHRPYVMNRLLQGDVGSGKTVVAAIAILSTILSGKQAVMLAPTEILAEQHANGLAKLFAGTDVNIALLTGATPVSDRKQMLPRIKNGEINLIIGTHALFQDKVKYNDLGLAVIDEQHRFGVNQRRKMREKGKATNVLSMTATPIPRTLSITAYGEMDVSVIDELPGGRKPIKTTWIKNSQIKTMLNFLQKHLKNNEQAYVIVPLIEESEVMDMRNVTETFEKFQQYFGNKYKVGLLHGKLNENEKNTVMQDFKDNKTQILVSTTVVEVGVDVSNASVMVIFDADHFGLAQLHQLRGRVGRGSQQSYCVLIADPKTEIGIKRMNVMSSSTDGFFISQKDLELRGPGDLLGKQQSGLPSFQVGDPIADLNILSAAQDVAKQVTDNENWKDLDENQELLKNLITLNENTSFD